MLQIFVHVSDIDMHQYLMYNKGVEGRKGQGSQPGIAPKGELRAAVKSGGMMEIVQTVTYPTKPPGASSSSSSWRAARQCGGDLVRAVPVSRGSETGSDSQARPPSLRRPLPARHAVDSPEANKQTGRHPGEDRTRAGGDTAQTNKGR